MRLANFTPAVFMAVALLSFTGCFRPRRPPPVETRPSQKPSGRFEAPLKRARVLSPFGRRGRRFHYGIDLQRSRRGGEPVLASRAGRVTHAGRLGGYGNMVEIRHADGFRTRYAHLRKIVVRKGRRVTVGEPLGSVGRTGRATTPHLHFEILTPKLKFTDPAPYLSVP